MSDADSARLARVEALLEQLLASREQAAAPSKLTYSAKEFAAVIGRSYRWVNGMVSIGVIPRLKIAGSRNVLIPASALDAFKGGKARVKIY